MADLTVSAAVDTMMQAANAAGILSAIGAVPLNGALGTPTSGTATNLTGTAAGLTAGNVTTNANLTGPVTSTGNATAIADAALSIAKTSGLQAALDQQKEAIMVAVSDETTALTTGTAKVTFRMPFAMTLTAVRANINTVSSSGIVTVDINEAGTTILSTKLTIDVSEKTSTTAAVPPVISDSALADDAEMTADIDVAGTGAKGLKIVLIGTRT